MIVIAMYSERFGFVDRCYFAALMEIGSVIGFVEPFETDLDYLGTDFVGFGLAGSDLGLVHFEIALDCLVLAIVRRSLSRRFAKVYR